MSQVSTLDIAEILKLLPHRYPFMLVDRVVDFKPGEYVQAYKNVTFNEEFFQGHFPGAPVMPGVLIIEALAQTGIVLMAKSLGPEAFENKLYLFSKIENARFRAPVRPGDRLDLDCRNFKSRNGFYKMDSKAYVDGKVVAEAQLTAAVAPREAL